MYKLGHFTETDVQKVEEIMQHYPFAVISGMGIDGYPVATQLPIETIHRGDKLFLRGHLMKDTDHHLAFEKSNRVMAVFTGPQHYISASWYVKKQVASTWNYISIQAKGIIQFLDYAETIKILEEITDKYEGKDSPASFSQLGTAYVSELAKYVVGFEIKVEHLENVFKLSQNHPAETQKGIICALEEDGSENAMAIARLMKRRL